MEWISKISNLFIRPKAIYLVRDDDNILNNAEVRDKLLASGYEVMDFDDSIRFRYEYDFKYRFNRSKILLIRFIDNQFEKVPYDIYKQSFKCSLSIEELVHNLNSRVIRDHMDYLPLALEIDDQQPSLLIARQTIELLNRLMEKRATYKIFTSVINNNLSSYATYATKIGEYCARYNELSPEQLSTMDQINKQFYEWLVQKYDSYMTIVSRKSPTYVFKIPSVMDYTTKFEQKKALIVIDGMSFAQWSIIQDNLEKIFSIDVKPVMACIPTVTSISRQSIFAGKSPKEFADTIETTNSEKSEWTAFWKSKGYKEDEIFYTKQLGNKDYQQEIKLKEAVVTKQIIGSVVISVDKFIHSSPSGLWSMTNELKHWLQQGFLKDFLSDLLDHDFDITITSDHGNITTTGIGGKRQGALIKTASKRTYIYDNQLIRDRVLNDYPKLGYPWKSAILPNDICAIVAKNHDSYAPKAQEIVSHGGASIQEVFVPYVRVKRRRG